MAGRGQQPGSPAAWSAWSTGACGTGCKICWWLAGRQSSAAGRLRVLSPPPVFPPPPLPPPQSRLRILCKKRHVALGRAVLEQRLHLRRTLDRWGPPPGAAPRALIRADVKWVWAPREGPGEDGEGARCAAGELRAERAQLPSAADQWRPRLAERAHGVEELPAPGRVPLRPWGQAGAAAGGLQVCPRAVTLGGCGLLDRRGAGCTGCIWGCLCACALVCREPVCPRRAVGLGAATRHWSFSE